MMVFPDDDANTIYLGPLDAVNKVVTAITAEGEILPIQAPSTNPSWTLNFHGPALSCEMVDEELQNDIMQNIRDAVNQRMNQPFANTSWIYFLGAWRRKQGPSALLQEQFNLHPTWQFDWSHRQFDCWRWSSVRVFLIADFPFCGYLSSHDKQCNQHSNILAALWDPHILECTVYNASYVTNFTYVNSKQYVKVESLEHLNDVWFVVTTNGQEPFTAATSSTMNSHLFQMTVILP